MTGKVVPNRPEQKLDAAHKVANSVKDEEQHLRLTDVETQLHQQLKKDRCHSFRH